MKTTFPLLNSEHCGASSQAQSFFRKDRALNFSGAEMSDFDSLCGNADGLLDENYSFQHALEAEIPLSDSLVQCYTHTCCMDIILIIVRVGLEIVLDSKRRWVHSWKRWLCKDRTRYTFRVNGEYTKWRVVSICRT
jgi:hypothetical protein